MACLENQETQDAFNFIAPSLKLPSRQAISNNILTRSIKQLNQSIIEMAQKIRLELQQPLMVGQTLNGSIFLGSFFIPNFILS